MGEFLEKFCKGFLEENITAHSLIFRKEDVL